MSQVRRVTPDVPMPESESMDRLCLAFATPWPLGEDYCLTSYSPHARRHGIYLVNSFGNRVLIHDDPRIACADPIPLCPRRTPPIIPVQTRQARADRNGKAPTTGTVAVTNVYDSDFPWPAGTKITALRIVQLFPKTTIHGDRPRIGAGSQALARSDRHGARRDRRQCALRGQGRRVHLLPGPRQARSGGSVHAVRHVRPPRRAAHLPGLSRAEVPRPRPGPAGRGAAGDAAGALEGPAGRHRLLAADVPAAGPARPRSQLRALPQPGEKSPRPQRAPGGRRAEVQGLADAPSPGVVLQRRQRVDQQLARPRRRVEIRRRTGRRGQAGCSRCSRRATTR